MVIYLLHKAVSRRWQVEISYGAMILDMVDQVLGMFDAYAECEGFGFNNNFFLLKQLKNIPCAVPGG